MSSIESSFSEAGESDAGGNNGNFSDTGSLMTNPAYRIAPGAKKDGAAGVVGGAERVLRSPRRSVVSDTELEQQTDAAESNSNGSVPQVLRCKSSQSGAYRCVKMI